MPSKSARFGTRNAVLVVNSSSGQDGRTKTIAQPKVSEGGNRNPDRATLEWRTNSREPSEEYTIVLTYSVDEIKAARRIDALRHQNPWVSEKHSLVCRATNFDWRKSVGVVIFCYGQFWTVTDPNFTFVSALNVAYAGCLYSVPFR